MSAPPITPFEQLGGEPAVRRLVDRFYARMAETEPALARLHPCDGEGRVARESQERFALFLIGWLGGPQDYVAAHGHPRLRMRHARVPVDVAMRDAWMRCMRAAMSEMAVEEPLRAFLDERLGEVAEMMRNRQG
jgi:hemoglobin